MQAIATDVIHGTNYPLIGNGHGGLNDDVIDDVT